MRILYVTARFPFGPGEAFLAPELKHVAALGHDALIFPVRPKGRRCHQEFEDSRVSTHSRLLWSPRVFTRSVQVATRLPPTTRAILRTILAGGSSRTRLKNVAALPKALYAGWLARAWGAHHIHAYWAATPATVAMIAAAIAGVPWTFTAHRWELAEPDILAVKLRAAWGARLISESGRQLLQAALARDGLPPKDIAALVAKTRVNHLGVDIPTSRSSRPASQSILCPARLVPVKGHAHLLEAFALITRRAAGAELLVAGDGPLKPQLVERAHRLGLAQQVRFLGHLPRAELLSMYAENRVSCVVLPSVVLAAGVLEGIPVSLMEAMSYGIPVVATATGGIPELLGGGAGLLVPESDPEALADAILQVLSSPGLWNALGDRGRARVSDLFSAVKCTREVIELMSADPASGAPGFRSSLPVRERAQSLANRRASDVWMGGG